MYDERALARLELIRALRELGASLADVERVLSRELDVPELVALQLEAVEAQRLAHISDDERKRIVEEFLDDVLGGLEVDPGLEARLRGGLPELPEDPTPEQIEAWVELAELVRDPDFRARIRQMAESGAAERATGDAPDGEALRQAAALAAERGGAALEARVEPGCEEAEVIVEDIARSFAGEAGDAAFRAELADRFEQGADPRAERYWQLLAVINGWPPVPTTMPAWHWTIAALRARPGG